MRRPTWTAPAPTRDSYTPGTPLATFPNDPNETPMRYDLYRLEFNDGRGGTPEAIVYQYSAPMVTVRACR